MASKTPHDGAPEQGRKAATLEQWRDPLPSPNHCLTKVEAYFFTLL